MRPLGRCGTISTVADGRSGEPQQRLRVRRPPVVLSGQPAAARLRLPKCRSDGAESVPFSLLSSAEGWHSCGSPLLKLLTCSLSILHCGHCCALLPPFGTVGNGRVGPGGAGLFIARLVKQRASPLPPTVTSFAPLADAWRRFRRVPRARAARRWRGALGYSGGLRGLGGPCAGGEGHDKGGVVAVVLGMAALAGFGRFWPLFAGLGGVGCLGGLFGMAGFGCFSAVFGRVVRCGAAGPCAAGPPLARPARSSSSRYFWLRLAGVARFWGFGRFGQNGGLVRNAQFRLELSERFDLDRLRTNE